MKKDKHELGSPVLQTYGAGQLIRDKNTPGMYKIWWTEVQCAMHADQTMLLYSRQLTTNVDA